MPDSFYEPDGDAYVATELTRGPWDPGAQHAGPPAALIGRAIERLAGGRMGDGDGPPAQVGRVTYEIMRSVPIGRLRVHAEVVRPGRRVELVQATLTEEEGEPLVVARGWRLPLGDGVPLRPRSLRRAETSDGLDADGGAPAARRGADPAAACARCGGLRQRRERHAGLVPLPVHQRRPQRAPPVG